MRSSLHLSTKNKLRGRRRIMDDHLFNDVSTQKQQKYTRKEEKTGRYGNRKLLGRQISKYRCISQCDPNNKMELLTFKGITEDCQLYTHLHLFLEQETICLWRFVFELMHHILVIPNTKQKTSYTQITNSMAHPSIIQL